MRTQRWNIVLAAALMLCGIGMRDAFGQNGDGVTEANQEYNAGHFQEAAELYDRAAKSGTTTAPLFYNLGNAWFRAGDLGRAVLNYERALALAPQHPEAEANLRMARDKARALELPPKWWDRFTARVSPTHYTIAAAASAWIAAFLVAAVFFRQRRSAVMIMAVVLALAVFAGSVSAIYAIETGSRGRAAAIVTAPNTEARLATADSAGTVLVLPAGSKILILSTRGDWIYAALPNGARGWIPAQSAEPVRL